MDFLLDILSFALKSFFIVLSTAIFVALIIYIIKLAKGSNLSASEDNEVKIDAINLKRLFIKRKKLMQRSLKDSKPKDYQEKEKKKKLSNKKKALQKLDKKRKEREDYINLLHEKEKNGVFCPENLYVLKFNGSVSASEVFKLRLKIDAILDVATDKDEVIVNLTSPGGMVNGYGLCASQLSRIRERGINLVCCVDSVAASGGYLMACVANKIVAAPFSYIGSIGVVASLPNFHRAIDKLNVDYELITAGKYKRTITMFGENTDEGREKFKEELEVVHKHFQDHVLKFRPNIDVDKVATGEHWLAIDALNLGLIDEISTSDEYIFKRSFETYNSVLEIKMHKKPKNKLLTKFKNLVSLKSPESYLNEKIASSLKDDSFNHIR